METLAEDTIEMESKTSQSAEDVTIEEIAELEARSFTIIDKLRQHIFAPNSEKTLKIRFTISDAERMVGRSAQAIREAEKVGRLPAPVLNESGRRAGYTLDDINRMREVFETLPHRAPTDEPVTIAFSNFKGGVAKSTTSVHFAQYMALQGYRVCVVDCDPQASTTNFFGLNPDLDVTEEKTLFPYLMHAGPTTLEYAVRKTYWPGVDLIPANLSLYTAEYSMAAMVKGEDGGAGRVFRRLRKGLESISHNYDVIVIDPPPALGMISLSVLHAANALIVPVPPSTVDFCSTAHFFSMLNEALDSLSKHGIRANYKFLKILATKVNDNKSAQTETIAMMQAIYGQKMMTAMFKDSAEIDNAASRLLSAYELEGPLTSRETHNRCIAYLNACNKEIEVLIRRTWPSHRNRLAEAALV